jgi:glycosyltransferase involved in cell wall biosynthesis
MFAYLGARGALPKFALDLAHVAAMRPDMSCTFMVSRANELFEHFSPLNDNLFAVPTFDNKWRSALAWSALRNLRARLNERLHDDRTQAFVSLMPHIWSPLFGPMIRKAGVRHIVVMHDADPHPGDTYALVNRWLLREAAMADHVITLSRYVAQRLTAACAIPKEKISVLFHPDLNYGAVSDAPVNEHGALRVLFMGRLLSYKGLGLLLDAVEILRVQNVPLQLGVFGQGEIEPSLRRRLSTLRAQVKNRWLHYDEIRPILARHDVLVAAHTEASQSGVVAAALGAGLPVVTTPVGGLVEQVDPGVTGIVAQSVTPDALARAIRELADDRVRLGRLRQGIATTCEQRSMKRFFDDVCQIAFPQKS